MLSCCSEVQKDLSSVTGALECKGVIFIFKSTSDLINLIKLSNYINSLSELYLGQEKSEKTFIGSIKNFN